jgi:hypothetical protein
LFECFHFAAEFIYFESCGDKALPVDGDRVGDFFGQVYFWEERGKGVMPVIVLVEFCGVFGRLVFSFCHVRLFLIIFDDFADLNARSKAQKNQYC